jgi:hypothetical protein
MTQKWDFLRVIYWVFLTETTLIAILMIIEVFRLLPPMNNCFPDPGLGCP